MMAETEQEHVEETRRRLLQGLVIPACPLALTAGRSFDERRQRALVRYYMAAGAGGLAVGVHTTQFEIHDPHVGLYRPVLQLAADTICEAGGGHVVKVAGLVGNTAQALKEAEIARSLGCDCGLLSLSAFGTASVDEMLNHCRRVAETIPLFGFYLQAAVGGRTLPYIFWRQFAEIQRVLAVKVAPFNRYQTLDVARAVADSGRTDEIALYTGNDDHIVGDLLDEYRFANRPNAVSVRFVGGLLGHWAVWTHNAVALLQECRRARREPSTAVELMTVGMQVTDSNAAFFDAANGFAGCIAGIHEVLRRQGLMAGRWCLNPALDLSPGQAEEIDRVIRAYPHLSDDAFVAEHLDDWLS